MFDEDRLTEVFAPFGRVRVRRMFGGGGIYLDGLIVALVIDDTLYLKADAETIPAHQAAGQAPFEYAVKGRVVQLSYWRIPEEALEDEDTMRPWAERARGAALRAQTAKALKAAGAARRRAAREIGREP